MFSQTTLFKKFTENKLGLLSLIFIILMLFVAVLAYVIAPDHSANANQGHLAIKSQPPGFTVLMLEFPSEHQNKTQLRDYILGTDTNPQQIPIADYQWVDQALEVTLYNQDPDFREIKRFEKSIFSATASKQEIEQQYIKNKTYYLGSDKSGRDYLSRMIIGSRVSLSIGFVAVFISIIVGVFFGSLAGYYAGRVDAAIMWLINIIWSIPTLLLVIAITLALGKGFWQVFLAVGLTMWVEVARVVRGQILSVKKSQYITAAKALGYSDMRILRKHILPNVMAPIIVISAANFASAILVESGLSFLGLGAQPPIPSWGGMIKESYNEIILGKAYLAVIPGVAISLLTLSFMMVGNTLRDALDVKS